MNLTKTRRATVAAALALTCTMTAADASPISATSYNTVNGNTGSYQYWDDTYSGSGDVTQNGAALSGGLGDLTNGVIAANNWFTDEAPAGPGPYVGWSGIDPVIDFFFAAITNFASATFHFDDANGSGGVSAPFKVNVNGTDFLVADPAGSAPFAFTVNLAGLMDDELNVQLFRNNQWVFLSEVTFEGESDGGIAPVPVPAAGLLLVGALGGLAALRRRPRAA